MPIASYDGAAEFWVEKIEDLLAVFDSEEYKSVRPQLLYAILSLIRCPQLIIPDESKFFVRENVQILIGEEQVKLEKALL